jgi:hypothetical protein
MPGFVQVMEFDTKRIDEIDALARGLEAELGDDFLSRKATTTADRDRPGHYYVIVEFDSYEEAMRNSENPVIAAYSQKMDGLVDGAVTFHNLDVVSVMDRR